MEPSKPSTTWPAEPPRVDADAFAPSALVPPSSPAAMDASPRKRPMRGLVASAEVGDSAFDRMLDSIDLGWLAPVSVVRTLSVPVGLVMALGWASGSFERMTGLMGVALFVSGSLTLLHAYAAADDPPGDEGRPLRAWLQPALGALGNLEVAGWAVILAAVMAWAYQQVADGIPGAARAAFALLIAADMLKRVLRPDDT